MDTVKQDSSFYISPDVAKPILKGAGYFWPGQAKEDARLLAEKLTYAELRYRKFRRYGEAEGVEAVFLTIEQERP